MAKKSRRARRRRTPRAAAKREVVRTPVEEKTSSGIRPSGATDADLAAQYYYVYSDLKRIAVLAGTMFAILILLSFVIR